MLLGMLRTRFWVTAPRCRRCTRTNLLVTAHVENQVLDQSCQVPTVRSCL